VRGGAGDSITIAGNGFGTTRGDGKVFFANADDGGMSYLALDSSDYGVWNDSLIKVNVPGRVDSIDQYNLFAGTPGGGYIMVKINGGADSIFYYGSPVTVNYSIKEVISYVPFLQKKRADLVNFDLTTGGGYVLRPDISITRSDSILAVVNTAVHDWVCETGVNWQLGDSIIALDGKQHRDALNIIQCGTPDDSNAVAETFIWDFPDPTCSLNYNRGFDMIIDSSLFMGHVLYADTNKCNDVPAGKYDLYGVILHELGHAIGLNHVNVQKSIMWFQQVIGASAPDRKVWLHKDHPTAAGGNFMTSHSQDASILNCGSTPMMSLLSLNDCDFALQEFVCYNTTIKLND
jgi:hypothetical protein